MSYGLDNMKIRKMIYEDIPRFDMIVDGKQKHIARCSDEEAINYFKSLNGKLETLVMSDETKRIFAGVSISYIDM